MNNEIIAAKKEQYKIMGMPISIFSVISIIVLIATYIGRLPKGMIGALALMMVGGAILNEIGDKTPIINTFSRWRSYCYHIWLCGFSYV